MIQRFSGDLQPVTAIDAARRRWGEAVGDDLRPLILGQGGIERASLTFQFSPFNSTGEGGYEQSQHPRRFTITEAVF